MPAPAPNDQPTPADQLTLELFRDLAAARKELQPVREQARWEAEAAANRMNKELIKDVFKYKSKSLALVEVVSGLQDHLLDAQTELDEGASIAASVAAECLELSAESRDHKSDLPLGWTCRLYNKGSAHRLLLHGKSPTLSLAVPVSRSWLLCVPAPVRYNCTW